MCAPPRCSRWTGRWPAERITPARENFRQCAAQMAWACSTTARAAGTCRLELGRVVAAGRNEEVLRTLPGLGADAVIHLAAPTRRLRKRSRVAGLLR
jgi:hypothetical protein